jgi:hypothetical protein
MRVRVCVCVCVCVRSDAQQLSMGKFVVFIGISLFRVNR